jgi:Na+-driven multidrug efflux pump
MGKPVSSTVLSMIREIVFGVGFALVLPVFFGLDGVLYSMPLSDILTFVIALFLIIRTFRELRRDARTEVRTQVQVQTEAPC